MVGLGASAGGIQALQKFFSNVPTNSNMAYVVILHMSPEHESRLAQVLQVSCEIPVTQVTEQEKIEVNHVYVIPPNQNLAIKDGHLQLKEMIGLEERRSPVDLFFRTLAETNDSRAVAVILSGTGANGSVGLKRIKEFGGIAFVQAPEEAEYKEMPGNAIATGMVDYVLPVAEIPAKIISYKEHLGAVKISLPIEDTPMTDEQALVGIFTHLRLRTGHDFSNYKRATMLRRIQRRLALRELAGLPEYESYLREHPNEAQALLKDLLISVTNFFRDPESLETLVGKVFPKIFETKGTGDPIRVWIAGCATGEEAYTIAMLLSEYIESERRVPNIQLFATDLDHEAIQIAREGFYRDAEVADISPERLRRFFTKESKGYRIRKDLRESILFVVHNVIKDPPFSHLDLISCRNLLIYLNRSAQARVLEVFHFGLNPTGHLLLGASESIEGAADLFVTLEKDHHIFRSRPVPPRAVPIPEVSIRPMLPPIVNRERSLDERRMMERLSYADLHQRLLEEYGPPSVIVNEDYDIVHLSDNAGRYLMVSGGEPSSNLLKLVRPELRLELRTALYQAVHDHVAVEVRDRKVNMDDGFKSVNLHVRPVLSDDDVTRGFVLILFEEPNSSLQSDIKEEVRPRTADSIAERLEDELERSRTQLRATVEQYEIQQEELRASNEELQAMNEELRSAAEELETSKEELQSVNEELTTVNQELKIKIEELSQANNNFQNLMNSTNIGTIFLDRGLRVRQFTPNARETFNLIASDIGRPLMDLKNKLQDETLIEKINEVRTSLQTVEREVHTVEGKSYMVRLSPYRTLEDKIDGVVISLFDITELSRAKEQLTVAHEELEKRVTVRTRELEEANLALRKEVAERTKVEGVRLKLIRKLVTAQEDERRRFALDLHDQLGQQLTLIRLRLDALRQTAASGSGWQPLVEELQEIVKQLDNDVDYLAWQSRPATLDDLGLPETLGNYVKQWSEHFGIKADFRAGNPFKQRLSTQTETNLYRIVQEALNNCAKHSQSSHAEVLLERRDGDIVLIVADNGCGFEPNKISPGEGKWGLLGMKERAALLGGTLDVESGPNSGTTIFVKVPLTRYDGDNEVEK